MITDLNNLVRLDNTQSDSAAKVLAKAFQDDPLFVYFFPDEFKRRNILPRIFGNIVQRGLLHGEVYATSANIEGVAVWFPYDRYVMPRRRTVRPAVFSMMLKMGVGSVRRMMRFGPYTTAMHERHAPFSHWHLQAIGVDPVLQGKGYASLLLKPMFARIDEEHLTCYLETHKQKNVSIYQHYGFKVVEQGTVPGSEVTQWAMLR